MTKHSNTRKPTDIVVVDGSNIATEGRSLPSLTQLNEAVNSFLEEHPEAAVTVVVDATFGHRIPKKETKEFDEAVANNELVAPPAGAIGRGDAFVLSIANKVGARVLSNDSFQEFHGDYPWLFDEGRLIGGKPVPNIGWIFVPRVPVQGARSRKAQRDAKPKATPAVNRRSSSAAASQPLPVPTKPPPAKPKAAASARSSRKAAAAGAGSVGDDRAKTTPPTRSPASGPAPVNDTIPFLEFVEMHPIGTSVNAEVESYSSHGAYAKVGDVRAYIPLSLMDDPPPRSARSVMSIGEALVLVVASFSPSRRSIDLAFPHMLPDGVSATEIAAGAESKARAPRRKRTAKVAPADVEAAAIQAAIEEAAAVLAEAAPAPTTSQAPRKRTPAKKAAAQAAPVAKKVTAKAATTSTRKAAPKKAAATRSTAKAATARTATTKSPATKTAATKAAASTARKAPAAKKTATAKQAAGEGTKTATAGRASAAKETTATRRSPARKTAAKQPATKRAARK